MKKSILFLLVAIVFLTGCRSQIPDKRVDTQEESTVAPVTTEFSYTATQSGTSAYDLLQSSATVEAQTYDLGVFVTSINGVKPPENSFWALYLNNEKAQKGATEIILQPHDVTTWKIESIQ